MKGHLRAAGGKSSSENNIIAQGLFISYGCICVWTRSVGCIQKYSWYWGTKSIMSRIKIKPSSYPNITFLYFCSVSPSFISGSCFGVGQEVFPGYLCAKRMCRGARGRTTGWQTPVWAVWWGWGRKCVSTSVCLPLRSCTGLSQTIVTWADWWAAVAGSWKLGKKKQVTDMLLHPHDIFFSVQLSNGFIGMVNKCQSIVKLNVYKHIYTQIFAH